jgi:D-alanyl-D-alanine dipeptidase
MKIGGIFFSITFIGSTFPSGLVAASGCNPSGFVFLSDIDPTIIQDIRYYSPHNFMGRRVEGYNTPACILTLEAATALKKVQEEAIAEGYTLKVYDCYRPQRAVDDFVAWSNNSYDLITKAEFYPTLEKSELFPDYIATKSGHTRGSTVDLTLVQLPAKSQAVYLPGQPLIACFESYENRYQDNSIDMGTGYDCMCSLAHTDTTGIRCDFIDLLKYI